MCGLLLLASFGCTQLFLYLSKSQLRGADLIPLLYIFTFKPPQNKKSSPPKPSKHTEVCSAWNAFLSSRSVLMSSTAATFRVKQLFTRLEALDAAPGTAAAAAARAKAKRKHRAPGRPEPTQEVFLDEGEVGGV